MNPGERFKAWIDSLALEWKDRLRGWMISWAAGSLHDGLELLEPGAINTMRATLTALKANPAISPEMRAVIDRTLATGDPLTVIMGWGYTILGAIPALLGNGAPLGRLMEQAQEALLQTYRLDPAQVITAWHRDPVANERLFLDLKEQGWSDSRIEVLKAITQVIPNAADIVRFALREVYSPEAVTYGQFQDIPTEAYADADKAGLPRDTFDKFWAAHWNLPSATDAFEMRHRDIIETDEELKGLLKALDIMPFWRDKMIALTWNIPTRVDVRRFWDMRTIDEARLREIYQGLGYHGRDLDDYVLWTKIYTDFPDLLARYKNGWITLDQVKSELIAMGMSPARAETLIQEKIKKAAPERVAKDRELTAAEIVKGVKKAVITIDEGIELLMDMGYDEWEARYKIAIEVAALTGSPESYAEFKDLTQRYRLAVGLGGKPMPEEIKQLGAKVVQLTAEVNAIETSVKAEQGPKPVPEGLPATATARLRELQATLYKAQAELSRIKTDYEAKVAEWKHAAK